MKYYLIVGEASGDLHASNLMKALLNQDPAAEFRYYGGDKMQAVEGTLVQHYKQLSYMGFIPVLLHLPTILRGMRRCKQDILAWQPDALILVDYPGFNLDIAQYIHRHSAIRIFYYIVPKIWAWKEYRIKSIRRNFDALYSILPFEADFFEKKHHCTHFNYVGNPCVDAISEAFPHLPTERTRSIAILPGSRRQEIKDNLSIMLESAAHFTDYKPVIAAAPNIEADYYHKYIPKNMEVEIVYNQTYSIVAQASAALVTSGTATLETALLNTPQVVCYYITMGWFFRLLRRLFLKVKYISLVNLVMDGETVPELVADDMNVEQLTACLSDILPGGKRRDQQLEDYAEMRRRLGPAGASERAAGKMTAFLKTLHKNSINP